MSRDHSQNHYGPNASFDGLDSDLAAAGKLIESLRQQLAVTKEKRADLEFVWNGCEQQLANITAHNVMLREALEQALDDMGEDGHCVCEAAKQQAIKALAALGVSA